MVNPGDAFPDGPDWVPRKVKELEKQVADLRSILATNAGQLAAIQQVTIQPQVDSSSSSGFSLTTSYITVASFSFTVPANATRCLVSASGFVAAITQYTGGDFLDGVVLVNGVSGPVSRCLMPSTSLTAGVTAFQTLPLTGLTAGGTIQVALQGKLDHGPSSFVVANSSVAASALFLS